MVVTTTVVINRHATLLPEMHPMPCAHSDTFNVRTIRYPSKQRIHEILKSYSPLQPWGSVILSPYFLKRIRGHAHIPIHLCAHELTTGKNGTLEGASTRF